MEPYYFILKQCDHYDQDPNASYEVWEGESESRLGNFTSEEAARKYLRDLTKSDKVFDMEVFYGL